MNLKTKIHGALIEQKNGSKNLLVEKKITEAQFLPLNKCKNYKELLENIIYKVNKLDSKGFNRQVVNESLIKVLRTLFGDFDQDFYTKVKEKYAEWLSSKMEFTNENEWIGNAIKQKIMEVPDEDFEKLFTCRYTAELMTSAMMSDFENKILSSGVGEEIGGPVGERFKELIMTASRDSGVQRDMEETMREKICPEIEKVVSKMDTKKEQLKSQISNPRAEQ